jgi:hypothetical protein
MAGTEVLVSCPGLHCAGCSEGQSLGVLGVVVIGLVVADKLCTWVAERIWWIGGTVAACMVLAIVASMALEARAERRGARFAERHGIRSRADVVAEVSHTTVPYALGNGVMGQPYGTVQAPQVGKPITSLGTSVFHSPLHLGASSDPARGEMQQAGETARAALGFRDLHIHLDGQPTDEQAAVIRQALGRNQR